MPIRCIVHFAQTHADFRLPELNSVAELYGIALSRPSRVADVLGRGGGPAADGVGGDGDTGQVVNAKAETKEEEEYEWDPNRPFWVVDFSSEADVRLICERCILVKAIYEHYASAPSYASLHTQVVRNAPLYTRFQSSTSFRFSVHGYNHSIPKKRVREVIDGFRYMDWKGPIELKNPEVELCVFEEYADRGNRTVRPRHENDGKFAQVFFGRLICQGKARDLVRKFDVKKRSYYGNTSMEAEISLLMANQTLASPGKLIYDPFIGTGSMAYTVAHFGAYVFGSDIDGRQMRGKDSTKEPGIMRSAAQYSVEKRILDLCTYDVTHNPLRCGSLFDAIITDPPYGVRAGAKKLGRKPTDKRAMKEHDPEREEAQKKGLVNSVPPTQPYELSELVSDLVQLARHLLKPAGRLVFFLPTVTEEYTEVDVEGMLCEGMEVVANSVQDFGSWGRRLITIKKTARGEFASPFSRTAKERAGSCEEGIGAAGVAREPAHKNFREKYFKGFQSEETVSTSQPELQLERDANQALG